ncbi:MAG: DUF1566 domain-containing protein [Bacteroidaceae bacterium]|nr:DUF1566 domain-containing protein [Bacteroidaceae bacterium]
MKTKAIMAAMLIACSVNVANSQTMVVNLANGSKMEFKTSEVTNVEFKEAEKKDDKPVTDDGQFANGHEYVDLGLPSGTLWAKCNIGANSPEEYGDYYAWGETETKTNYTESTYKYSPSSTEKDADGFDIISEGYYTKYVPMSKSSDYGYEGFYDDKTELELDDDVAHVKWGGDWRMPTKAEQDELINNCTWDWKELKGVKGYKVTGANGKFIFLPAAGFYWSSSLNESYPSFAYGLYFDSSYVDWINSSRYYGRSVRAVRRQ